MEGAACRSLHEVVHRQSTARPQHPPKLGVEPRLVGYIACGMLGPYDVEACVIKGKPERVGLLEVDLNAAQLFEPRGRVRSGRRLDRRRSHSAKLCGEPTGRTAGAHPTSRTVSPLVMRASFASSRVAYNPSAV